MPNDISAMDATEIMAFLTDYSVDLEARTKIPCRTVPTTPMAEQQENATAIKAERRLPPDQAGCGGHGAGLQTQVNNQPQS